MQLERETCICYFNFINPIGSFLDPAAMAPQSLKESKRWKSNFDGLNLFKKAKVPNLFLWNIVTFTEIGWLLMSEFILGKNQREDYLNFGKIWGWLGLIGMLLVSE